MKINSFLINVFSRFNSLMFIISRFNSWYSNKTGLYKFVFCGLLFASLFATIFNVPLYRYIIKNDGGFAIILPVFLILVFNYFALFSVLSVMFVGRVLILIVLVCSFVAVYYMQFMSGCISYDVMESVFETNKREALELFSITTMILLFIYVVLCVFVIKILIFRFERVLMSVAVRAGSVLLCLFLAGGVIYVKYDTLSMFIKNNNSFVYYINVDNYVGNSYRVIRDKLRGKIVREVLDETPVIKRENSKKKFIILLVGETSRAMSYSLNGYKRETNPNLKKYLQDGSLINFENATSCGTATVWSVPCMFDYRGRKQFNKKKYYENVLSLTGKAGVSQVWYENDDGAKMQNQQCEYISVQSRKHHLCSNNECKDEIFLEDLDNEISKFDGKNDRLMVMHMIGSHGPLYYLRYKREFAKFRPECNKNNTHECSKEELYNAYDNTILYQDWVISQMIERLQKMKQDKKNKDVDITLWFMSDHGESLGEHGFYLHAFPYSIAPKEQTHIPFFIWTTDDKLRKTLQEKAKLNKEGKLDISHDNLFYTLLGLLNVESKVKNDKLDLTK